MWLKIECKTSFMTKLLCYNQKISAEEQVFSLLIFFNMADIVGTTVANER